MQLAIVVMTVVLTLSLALVWGSRNNYVPCIADCGETFIAQHVVKNFRLFGLEFGLIEDHATSPSAGAHPYYYTHNVNIGSFYYLLLDLIGVTTFHGKQFFVLLVFGLGLFYAYAAVAEHTKSRLAGYCVLVAACLDFGFFFSFAFHALRVWTWLALFGLLLHAGRIAQARESPKCGDLAAVFIFSTIAFGIGYDFWIIVAFFLVAVNHFFSYSPVASGRYWSRLGLFLVCLLVPFLVRQVHIAAVLGTSYWSKDFYYSFASKIPLAGWIFELPAETVIEQFYQSHNILRPPTQPIEHVGQFKDSLLQLYKAFIHVIAPTAGTLTICITALICSLAIGIGLWRDTNPVREHLGPSERHPDRRFAWTGMDIPGGANVLASLSVGLGLGCLLLVKMVVPYYFAMGMPLVGVVFVVAKGVVVATLIAVIRQLWLDATISRWLALLALAFVGVDHAVVQAANIRAARPMDTSWVPIVSARPNATYAVSFIAPVVSGFTSNWVVGIKTGREWESLRAVARGDRPFFKSDLFWFGERDADQVDYLRPDYWLYFPTDKRASYLTTLPNCRQDYLARLATRFISARVRPEEIIESYVVEAWEGDEGSTITIQLKLNLPADEIHFTVNGKEHLQSRYNCVAKTAIVQLPVDNVDGGLIDLRAKVLFGGQGREARLPVRMSSIRSSGSAIGGTKRMAESQPSVGEILQHFSDLPIEAVRHSEEPWQGFVLIDLRHLRGADR